MELAGCGGLALGNDDGGCGIVGEMDSVASTVVVVVVVVALISGDVVELELVVVV